MNSLFRLALCICPFAARVFCSRFGAIDGDSVEALLSDLSSTEELAASLSGWNGYGEHPSLLNVGDAIYDASIIYQGKLSDGCTIF